MTSSSSEQNAWPKKDILWLGYFGSGTPAGRRYRNRSLSALLVLVLVQFAFALAPKVPAMMIAGGWAAGLVFSYIAVEWWRYLESLDELARRLQMEAMAWTYVWGVAFMMALGGMMTVWGWKLSPALFILLEPVRAWRLWSLTRKY